MTLPRYLYGTIAGDDKSTWEQCIGQIGRYSTENKFAAGSQFWRSLKLILSLVDTNFLIWTSENLQKN